MSRNLMSLFMKIISLYNPIHIFAILYPTLLANLVVEVGTRHSHQILLDLRESTLWLSNQIAKESFHENALTHWGRVTHIWVGNLTIIGSDNGLSPGRRQAIIWTSAGILLIRPLDTSFSEILIGIQTFSFKKMHLKMSSAKWRPFCPGLNVLRMSSTAGSHVYWGAHFANNFFYHNSNVMEDSCCCNSLNGHQIFAHTIEISCCWLWHVQNFVTMT